MSKIYNGSDRARELKFSNFREMMFTLASKNNQTWNKEINEDLSIALYAHVNAGRWGVICECGTGQYADLEYRYNFCATCGNAAINGALRLVIFPENYVEIEKTLLEREINSPFDIGTQTILMPTAKPQYEKMYRSWVPGETVEHLKDEHNRARAPKEGCGSVEDAPPLPALLDDEKGGK